MTRLYQKPDESRNFVLSLALGIVAALFIFLLVPLTQMSDLPDKPENTIEELVLAVLPPPPPPRDPPPPEPESEQEAPPELETLAPMPTLEQLEVSLNPGLGGALTIEVGTGFDFSTESASDMMRLYGFDELDESPHVTRQGRVNYPVHLQRRRVEGYVKLLIVIDPSGRVEVREVLSYSHKEFIAPAKAGAAATRFSVPMRNGAAVSAQYSWKIEFSLQR